MSSPADRPVLAPVNDAVPAAAPTPRDADAVRCLLAHVNRLIVGWRRALRHDHRDAAWWSARGVEAAAAQSQRDHLRRVADLLHVERAAARGRVHGTRFADLADQQRWLLGMLDHTCPRAAAAAGLPRDATLRQLRAGMLPAPPPV